MMNLTAFFRMPFFRGVKSAFRISIALGLFSLFFTLLVYWNGLRGSFMFDDFQTLETLGDFNGVRDWGSLLFYLDSGHAGPTGRPIAMLSFLLNGTNWPADPYLFKLTNLALHLLCGALIHVVTLRLLAVAIPELTTQERAFISLLASGWWLLNPLHVSTTLYVVQRMTQLATLFTLLGMLCYLHGRALLSKAPRLGYAWMTFAIIGMGMLAVFSKENGALLPLLILLTEAILIRQKASAPLARHWKILFLWIPALSVIAYLIWVGYQFTVAPLTTRSFSLSERLLTESRIIWQYLYNLLVPRLDGGSFFGDDLQLSRNLISPPATLFSCLGWAAAILFFWLDRKRHPLLSFSILFFLAGHLIESTTVPLELYFEHRNYLPSAFLALPVSAAAVRFFPRRPLLVTSSAVLILMLLGGMTWQRASLWGDTEKLYIYWALQSPGSARAQTAAIGAYTRANRPDLAFSLAKNAMRRNPDNLLLNLQWISFFRLRSSDQPEVRTVLKTARSGTYEEQALAALIRMTEECEAKSCNPIETRVLRMIVDALLNNPNYHRHAEAVRLMHQLDGRLHLVDNSIPAAIASFSLIQADAGYPETGLLQVALLASKGYYLHAIQQLDRVKTVVNDYNLPSMKKEYYLREINRLEQILQQDLHQSSESSGNMKTP